MISCRLNGVIFLIIVLGELSALQGCASQKAALNKKQNPTLQCALSALVLRHQWLELAEQQRLAFAVADITDPKRPEIAGINPYTLMYAASVPKLAILFAIMKKIDQGAIAWTDDIREKCEAMIRNSSNPAATELYYLAGPDFIIQLLTSPEYKLYDLERGGGLWIGKEYGSAPAQYRDPLKALAHAATPFSLLRFYYLMDSGYLVSPESTARMREVLSKTVYDTKFVRGLHACCPTAEVLRKAGGWREFDSDSALISHGGRRYIIAGLVNDPRGEEILSTLAIGVDLAVHHPEKLCATESFTYSAP